MAEFVADHLADQGPPLTSPAIVKQRSGQFHVRTPDLTTAEPRASRIAVDTTWRHNLNIRGGRAPMYAVLPRGPVLDGGAKARFNVNKALFARP
jgi:hypothetical protein